MGAGNVRAKPPESGTPAQAGKVFFSLASWDGDRHRIQAHHLKTGSKQVRELWGGDAKGGAAGAIVGEKHRQQFPLGDQQIGGEVNIGGAEAGVKGTKTGVFHHVVKVSLPLW
jgi:hypothetical protein